MFGKRKAKKAAAAEEKVLTPFQKAALDRAKTKPFENSQYWVSGDYAVHYRVDRANGAEKGRVFIVHGFWLNTTFYDELVEALNAEGVIIAVQSGTTGEAYVQENFPKATVQPYGNSTDAFAALQSGQANAVCTNLAVVESMLATAYQDAEIVKSIATGEEYAIVISQDNAALLEAVNGALATLTSNGTIDKLIEQYM